ncbi:DEAD/DEAH box helicase [Candidatus Haliotispira prima]|uniref:DEAD/DEAH box helicase n=1 Tax=Candidatus Haliotispira prima TaxID=3034016 RepID=A0ABY8MK96_9SPIO|nr:DEAD/DEAH box helicase [Candidatus Haliotispira prima]
MKFEEFPLVPALQKAVAEIGFIDCTPVQEQSFTAYFEGKDIYAQSQTGTGKTAAFMLCGLQELIRRNQAGEDREQGQKPEEELPEFAGDIKMLILSPTRELAEQIEQEGKLLARFLPLQIAAFYGGVGYEKQRTHLSSGVQIITGTPGRIIDLAKSGELPLHHVQVIVLDEADRMLDMGFIDDVRWIMSKLPPTKDRMTMLFSATLTAKVGNLTWEFMRANQVAEIIIEPEQITTENVEQELYHVSNREKLRLLLSLIKKLEPESALIFCNTKSGASFLERRLRDNGYQIKALMGDLPQIKRTQIVGQLKAGKLRFVVATDVASRGLHVDSLPLVINYDLPDEAENYVHRIGRTARAGAAGKAISMACERYVYNLADIERYIENKIPVTWFPEEELIEDQSSGHRNDRSDREYQGNRRERGESRSSSGRPPRSSNSSGSGSRERDGERRGRRQSEGSRDRSREGGGSGGKTSSGRRSNLPKEPPKDKDERLKYYQQKYGENFGVEDGSKPTANTSHSRDGANRRRPQRSSNNGSSNGNGGDKGRNNDNGNNRNDSRPNRGQNRNQNGRKYSERSPRRSSVPQEQRQNSQPRPISTPENTGKQGTPAKPGKKPGLLQRLFGRK